jgi:hypothetical protein
MAAGRLTVNRGARPFLLLFVAAAWGCDQGERPWACAAYAAAGLNVAVTNAATGQPLCDASVTATEGAYSEQLFGGACAFAGAIERPGTYVIRAERRGFVPKEVRGVAVVMDAGLCPHVTQVQLAIALAPEG